MERNHIIGSAVDLFGGVDRLVAGLVEGMVAKRGGDIPKAAFVTIRRALANRDETLFAHPDNLDQERRNAMRHIAFGSGIHTCMRAQLARMELKTAFRHILDGTTFSLGGQAGGFRWFESSFFMGLAHLRLRMEGRA